MARVNHKLVKQRMNEKRSKISDRQFFSSRLLAGHFEDMAAAQTRRYRYNRRIRVNLRWQPHNPDIAHTDNQQVRINAGHPMVTAVKGRENRYWLVCGIMAHEMGHILYTDFLAMQTYHNSWSKFRWFPSAPKTRNPKEQADALDIMDYIRMDEYNLKAIQYIAHHLINILEDGYVENRMLTNFPGTLGHGLSRMREVHWEQIPTVTDLIESEEDGRGHIFESIMQILLSYAKFGEIKYGDEPLTDFRIQTVFSLIPDIDTSLTSISVKERMTTVNLILVRCWEQVKELCEILKQIHKDAEASGAGGGSFEGNVSGARRSLAGSTGIGTGTGTPVAEMGPAGNLPSATAGKRQQTRAQAVASGESSEEEAEATSGDPASGDESEEKHEDSATELEISAEKAEGIPPPPKDESGEPVELTPSGRANPSEKQETTSEESGRIPLQQTESVSVPLGGTLEINEEYEREMDSRAASDIERLLDEMAERAATKELETERLRELNDAAQSISYGDIHEGVSIRVNRIAAVDEELVEGYDRIAAPLITISKQLRRSLIKQLQESRRGGKQTGLFMGRRLDSHALHRNDGKAFYKNALPNEVPELAVALLLDESGSMGGCDRSTYARASAIILYDFCQSLGIPIMVYGHSTGWSSGVQLYSYAEFDAIDHDDKYRMMDIAARASNRDGAALRFVADRLSRRPETIKILILVSDGQPADDGYYGSAAEEDLRGIKQEYQRKGILFVAAAIGNDKENIERIYGDSFMDITDLEQLPVKLTNVVKRFVRV